MEARKQTVACETVGTIASTIGEERFGGALSFSWKPWKWPSLIRRRRKYRSLVALIEKWAKEPDQDFPDEESLRQFIERVHRNAM